MAKRIAIIGAGLAGLSCAHELEKHGIDSVIYEKNSFIGEEMSHVGATLEIITRPMKDAGKYFSDDLGISITPLNTVNTVIHYSPNKKTDIKGNLGYFFERSKGPNDIKRQIFSKLKSPNILFNTLGDYKTLSSKFDYVVIASGNSSFSSELGCWMEKVNTYVRGAVVLGNFDPTALIVWLNKDYCKNGYAYLTPFSKQKASLILIATDVNEKEIDFYWELFMYTENIKYKIVEEFKLNHRSGNVFPHRIGNIYLAGNAGGTIDPFLGFGVVNSVTTGVMAARSIAKDKNYEKLISGAVKRNIQLYEFRKAFNNLSNADLDLLVSSIGLPGLKHITYYTPLNVVKLGSYVLKLTNQRKKN